MAHQRARTQSRGSTLTACGRATLDGVKRHPHPRGCSSLELLPLDPPRIGNGAKPRIWVKGRVPCGVQGRSPLPCRAQVISNPLRYGVTCRAYKGGNPYQSSFTADTGTYRLCADKVVCKRVYEVERILLN